MNTRYPNTRSQLPRQQQQLSQAMRQVRSEPSTFSTYAIRSARSPQLMKPLSTDPIQLPIPAVVVDLPMQVELMEIAVAPPPSLSLLPMRLPVQAIAQTPVNAIAQTPVNAIVQTPVNAIVQTPVNAIVKVEPLVRFTGGRDLSRQSSVLSLVRESLKSMVKIEPGTASPVVLSPVQSSLQSPILIMSSPVQSPVRSPVQSPVRLPVRSPVKSPVKSPVRLPVRSPVQSPVQSPVKSPVKSPVRLPVRSPVKSPVRLPVRLLVQSSIQTTTSPSIQTTTSPSIQTTTSPSIQTTTSPANRPANHPAGIRKPHVIRTANGQRSIENNNINRQLITNEMKFTEITRRQVEADNTIAIHTKYFMGSYENCVMRRAIIFIDYKNIFGIDLFVPDIVNIDQRIIDIMKEEKILLADYNTAMLQFHQCANDINNDINALNQERLKKFI